MRRKNDMQTTPDRGDEVLNECPRYGDLVELTIRKIPKDRVRLLCAHLFSCRRCTKTLSRIRDEIDACGPDTLAQLRGQNLPIPEFLRGLESALTRPGEAEDRAAAPVRAPRGAAWFERILEQVRAGAFTPSLATAFASDEDAGDVPIRVFVVGEEGEREPGPACSIVVPPTVNDLGEFFFTADLASLPGALMGAEAVIVVETRLPRRRKSSLSSAATRLRGNRVHLSSVQMGIPVEAVIRDVWVVLRREGR
jgi:hypothetical protein